MLQQSIINTPCQRPTISICISADSGGGSMKPLTLNIKYQQNVLETNKRLNLNILYVNDTFLAPIKSEKVTKYTLPVFLEKARTIHGNKYNYDRVIDRHIQNKDSKVPIACNTCMYEWNQSIKDIIKGKKCPMCDEQPPWTYGRFIQNARIIYGDRYNYDKIKPSDIHNYKSEIILICNICGYEYSQTIDKHINYPSNCPICAGQFPWTYDRFIEKVKELYGDNYNYINVLPGHIKGIFSNITIMCNTCGNRFYSTINEHIHMKYGCPVCIMNIQCTSPKVCYIKSELPLTFIHENI